VSAAAAVVVGAGPAGLAAAIEMRRRAVPEVMLLEREPEAGGIPRHAQHQGFGLRDLRRPLSGPAYARRYVRLAGDAGVDLRTETMVTGWSGEGGLELTSPRGRESLTPGVLVLATGCRERPRSARLVPGSRPEGVMTTGMLQQLVYLHGRRVGSRAVIVGAEHVSFSAVATLAHGGASVTALVTELPRHQSLAAFRIGAAIRYRAPVWTRTAITRIEGEARVELVELTDLDSGRARTVPCDLVIFTAGWVPDHELAAMAGCELDPGTRGPRADSGLRTTVPCVFAAGNVVHPAETADACGLGGRHVAATVAEHVSLGHGRWPAHVPVHARRPLRWVAPNLVAPDDRTPLGNRVLLRSEEFLRLPRIEVGQDGRTLWGGRLARLVPGRSAHIPGGWTAKVDPEGGPVSVRVVSRRPR
jgi:thioredoxin reductase